MYRVGVAYEHVVGFSYYFGARDCLLPLDYSTAFSHTLDVIYFMSRGAAGRIKE